ncbi:MAG TPA: hypothetical protein VLG92_00745 [Candidatus Saccharimonadia bacterium]|nr:hypothetical protein [Candidatus Saccharimonadia bacterium]
MFKKRAKPIKRLTVYRPNVLEVERIHHVARPGVAPRSPRSVPGMAGDILLIFVLGLVTTLVILMGNVSQSAVPYSRTLASVYDPNVLTHASVSTSRAPSKHHIFKAVPKSKPVAAVPLQPHALCDGKTVMNVVAHEDDDLLFINPDISHDLAHHDCVRTIYITAGDDGRGTNYLRQREAGSQAAYSVMLHTPKLWEYQPITLPSGAIVTAASPQGDPNVSLVFLRLPDGNLNGEGFASTGNQSIARLKSGAMSDITSVDEKHTYTSVQLIDTLTALMEQYQPKRINTQAQDSNLIVADHSDHVTTGQYTALAATAYAEWSHRQVIVRNFMGYPIRAMLPNLPATDVAQKSAAFFAYAADDPGVCVSIQMCVETNSTYGFYLERQYLGVGQ